MKALGPRFVEHFYEGGGAWLGEVAGVLLCCGLLISPKPVLTRMTGRCAPRLMACRLSEGGGALGEEWELEPVHWAVLLGGKCSVADFRKLAVSWG
jgi:hypothetical protein